jgi:hypothetical protein
MSEVPYSQRAEWADVQPLPVTDDAGKVVAIQYETRHKETLGYFRACLAKVRGTSVQPGRGGGVQGTRGLFGTTEATAWGQQGRGCVAVGWVVNDSSRGHVSQLQDDV